MKKFLLSILCFYVFNSVNAANMPDLPYKNIKIKEKIFYNQTSETWSKKADKKSDNYYTKTNGFGNFYDYVDSNKNFVFSTNCEYEFIYKGNLIGYSNSNMKFYNITYKDNQLKKTELSKEEVETIFPDYKIITCSDFSTKTNSLKIKKEFGNLKIILLNDTNNTFDKYTFTSGNAHFKKYDLKGFLTVTKPGMVQFANFQESNKNLWFVILVR